MTRIKKWLLVLGVAGTINFSCYGMLSQSLFNAAVDGASDFVAGYTTDTLASALVSDD